jgi:hypothetical protein
VTYRLSQLYGPVTSPPRPSVDSLLIVTVLVRSRGCSEQVRRIIRKGDEEEVGTVPLATSVVTPRAASALTAAAATLPGVETMVRLIGMANEMILAATYTTAKARGGGPQYHAVEDGRPLAWHESSPLVAEVVGMEELWNGVRLIDYVPFRWARRLNGFLVACACYFCCD